MRFLAFSLFPILAMFIAHGQAWALGGDHSKDAPVVGNEHWPTGLAPLLERAERVHGFFVNANDSFFLAGNTQAFNAFLKEVAALKATPIVVVLCPGRGRAASPWWKQEGKAGLPCDWRIDVLRRGWHPKAPAKPGTDNQGYVVQITLWTGGRVRLENVVVPGSARVEAADAAREADPAIKAFFLSRAK